MKTTIHSIAALLLTIAFAAQAESRWSVKHSENAAVTYFPNGIVVGVLFHESTNCHNASLIIYGNGYIDGVAINIDGELFTSDNGPDLKHSEGVGFTDISADFLSALKHGHRAYIVTDEGDLKMSLQGSAAAINEAWETCLLKAAANSI